MSRGPCTAGSPDLYTKVNSHAGTATGIPLLHPLEAELITEGPIPRKWAGGAAHIAIATVFGCEYLLSWNCRHIDICPLWLKTVGAIGSFPGTVLHAPAAPGALATPGDGTKPSNGF